MLKMGFENKKGKRKLSRREFMLLSAITIASLVLYGLDSPIQKELNRVQTVTITLRYINHTRGPYGTKVIIVESGSSVTVTPLDVANGSVDAKRIAVREEGFGKLIVFSDTGEARFVVPEHNTTYEIYGFNIKSGAHYSLMDDDIFAGRGARLFMGKHFLVAGRRDWDTMKGPEHLWKKVFSQLNRALKYKWATYGYISRRPKAAEVDFCYGYGIPPGRVNDVGWHQGNIIYVRSDMYPVAIFRVSLAEAFELICQVDDVGGRSSYNTIWDGGYGLSRIGRDLFAYVFVKE
jgi:hypothetical protein